MKTKILRRVVMTRNYLRDFANTERGEKIIVRTLTTLTFIGIADFMLLIIGEVCSRY